MVGPNLKSGVLEGGGGDWDGGVMLVLCWMSRWREGGGRRCLTHIGRFDERNEGFLGPRISVSRRAAGVVALDHLHLLGELVRAPLQHLHTKSHMN